MVEKDTPEADKLVARINALEKELSESKAREETAVKEAIVVRICSAFSEFDREKYKMSTIAFLNGYAACMADRPLDIKPKEKDPPEKKTRKKRINAAEVGDKANISAAEATIRKYYPGYKLMEADFAVPVVPDGSRQEML